MIFINMWKGISNWWNDAKFDYSIKAIFIFAVIVSFSHTIELYSSVGFDIEIKWLNNLLRVDFITLALFATLAAEAAFAVGLWGLYEAYKQHQSFPSIKEFWQVWTLFGCGLGIVGWSNIGGTVGYDFLLGQPYKGIALGLSIPLFVLGAVLVNFKRMNPNEGAQIDIQKNDEQTMEEIKDDDSFNSWATPNPSMQKEEQERSPAPITTKEEEEETPFLYNSEVEALDKKVETIQPEKKEEKENYALMEDQEKNEIPPVKTDDEAEATDQVAEEETEEISTEEEKEAYPAEDQEKISNQESEEETPKSEQETNKEKEEKQPASLDEKRDEMDRVEKIARDIWKKEGKRPGRIKIETLTNCSEKTSRKIAKKLLEEEKRKAKAS